MEVNSPLNTGQKSGGNPLNQLETALADLFKKAPALPAGVKEFIVKFGPYILTIAVIGWALSLLNMFGVGGLATFNYYGIYGTWSYYWTVIMLSLAVQTVLEAIALPGLFKRAKQGWEFMFYAALVGIVGNILSLNILTALLSGAVSLYLIFQIREYYK